jgi:hypothetical protein
VTHVPDHSRKEAAVLQIVATFTGLVPDALDKPPGGLPDHCGSGGGLAPDSAQKSPPDNSQNETGRSRRMRISVMDNLDFPVEGI